MHALAQLVDALACRHWDLGSIPRSPHIFHNFSPNAFQCSVQPKAYHASSHASLPHTHEDQSEGYKRSPTMYVSQCTYTRARKSNRAWILMGQKYSNSPPKRARHPPLVCIFFNSIFFSFF